MITDTTYTNNCGTLQNVVKLKNEAFHKRLKRLYPCVDDVSTLPQSWSSQLRAAPLGLTHDNLGCYFRGRRIDDDKSAAAVKADNVIPPSCFLYYFEVEFVSKGREGYMGLGLSTDKTPIDKLPGWDTESYGYHAEDGNIYENNPRGHPFGPVSTTGDVVGCGYNLVERKIFFTRNGTCLGKAFDDVPSNVLYYPTIGLRTPGEEIQANFGHKEFMYDIEQDLRSLRKNMTFTISNYPISDFGSWQNTLHTLVQSWLLRNSYPNTAEAFTKSAKIECKENMQRVQQRNRIQQLIMSGKISEAISLTNRICPNLLKNNPNLLFALKCRQFIELISGADNDFQPMFNDIFENSRTNCGSANSNNSTTCTDSSGSNNILQNSNGIHIKMNANGDHHVGQLSTPHNALNNPTDANVGSNIGTNVNGCNGMFGDNNCEKVDDQHSTSSSSYQELMDVDQPTVPAIHATSPSNNHHRNSTISNNDTTHKNNNNNAHHPNDKSPSTSSSVDQPMLTNITNHQNNEMPIETPMADLELDCNEQKYAKLLLFGQELCDYLHQLNKTFGKDDRNEKMLQDAISLIAYINPKSDPKLGKQLDPSGRELISQVLNSSIVDTEMGDSSKPPLEEVMNHLKLLVRLNSSHGRWLVDKLYEKI